MTQPQRTGQQLGNYRLTRLLGTGGFAEVYLGEHVHLRTDAAIKVLHTRVEQEDAAAFGDEARTIARLKHPHIVRVLDFGIDGTLPYLVMDYAPQGSLRSRHARGAQLPLEIVRSYVQQLAGALQYAHERKLIHRDLKPENILVDESGELMLSDFGIATMAQSSRSQNTQDIVGTAAYMAPEQLQGKPRPASDQYSFAIMVYEWLTGTRPFQGTFTEIASQHLLTPPPPLRVKRADLPSSVEQVIITALQKDPHQRFGSVKAFATAFEQACEQSLQNANEAAIETQRASNPPDRGSAPSPLYDAAASVELAPTVEPLSTPPAAWPVAPTHAVISSGPVQTPPTPPLIIAPQNASGGQPASPKRAAGRRWMYGFVAALLVVVLVVVGIGIYQSQLKSTGETNSTNQQKVTVGSDITSIQVGGGYDPASGQVQSQSSTFHQGDTIFLVSQILPTDMQASVPSITDTLSDSILGSVQVEPGSIDIAHNVYFNSVVATVTGDYTWVVKYQGTLEASITFQIV